MKTEASNRQRRESKETLWEFKERSDVGVVVEQSWMFREVTNILNSGRLIFCFTMDKDILLWKRGGTRYVFVQSNGASIAACRVEEMVGSGATILCRIGTCGALQNRLNIGDVVLTTAAIKDEGTSSQYLPLEFPSVASRDLLIQFEHRLEGLGIPTHVGMTWTTDGRFVQSDEKISTFSKLGVLNVDMETSAFLTVCMFRRVAGLSVGIVTDKPVADVGKKFKGRLEDPPDVQRIVCKVLARIVPAVIDLGSNVR